MTKLSPARYRTKTWPGDNVPIRKRGSQLIWLDWEMARLAPPAGSPGRPAVFVDAAMVPIRKNGRRASKVIRRLGHIVVGPVGLRKGRSSPC